MSIALQVALVMVTILVILLIIGAPIGVAIGLSSAVSMICMIPANVSFATSAQRIFAGSNSFSFLLQLQHREYSRVRIHFHL